MKIILASKSGVRKKILDKYNVDNEVIFPNVDEDEVKKSLLSEQASPISVSKNLAEIKSIKVSNQNPDRLVLGADSVISLNNELINKPNSREEAYEILKARGAVFITPPIVNGAETRCFFRDPDGHLFEISEYRASS